MVRKFINGLLFGAGFAIAFIIIMVVYFKFFFESTMNSSLNNNESVVSDVPGVPEVGKRFLGSPAIYAGGFLDNKSGVLKSGAGEIKGSVTSNGKPTQDLKLRLALNGKVMSQWATTNSFGEYAVSVPYGKYKIDGYELDNKSANEVLAGLIDNPTNPHSSGAFSVTKDKHGVGISFKFIDPILKTTQQATYNLNEPVVISWEPYTGAVNYSLQVYEKSTPHEYLGNNTLFSWSSRPQISETSIDLKDYTQDLKSGNYYSYEIRAIGGKGRQISETSRVHQGYDFKIE
jgi:hypothetical protein